MKFPNLKFSRFMVIIVLGGVFSLGNLKAGAISPLLFFICSNLTNKIHNCNVFAPILFINADVVLF